VKKTARLHGVIPRIQFTDVDEHAPSPLIIGFTTPEKRPIMHSCNAPKKLLFASPTITTMHSCNAPKKLLFAVPTITTPVKGTTMHSCNAPEKLLVAGPTITGKREIRMLLDFSTVK
jgi:hypothetical protein